MLIHRGRTGLALCAATVVTLTTCLAAAPAQAATGTSAGSSTASSNPLGGLGDVLGGVGAGLGTALGGVGDGLGTIVGGVGDGLEEVLGGLTGGASAPTPTTSASASATDPTAAPSPTATGSSGSGSSSSSSGIGAGVVGGVDDILGGVTDGVGEVLGGVTDGVGEVLGGITGTGAPSSSTPSSDPAPTATPVVTPAPTETTALQDPASGSSDPATDSGGSTGDPSSTPAPTGSAGTDVPSQSTAPGESAFGAGSAVPAPSLSALAVTSSVSTLYPADDGYRDEAVFSVHGTTADGSVQAVTGTAALTYGAMTVATWPITSTNQQITWEGLVGSKIKTGRYVLTAVVADGSGGSLTAVEEIDVSAQKLATATTTVKSKAVSGVHAMAAKAKAGLSKGKVVLRVKTVARGVKGKQYLVLTHAGKKVRIQVRNGKHTSKAVTLPSSFTTFRITHTWKGHSVRLTSATYAYSYKRLR